MFLTRKNLNGGRPFTGFPLVEIEGCIGRKLGYCEHCNEPILVKTIDVKDIMAYFWYTEKEYKNVIDLLQPKIAVKTRLIKWLVGKLGEHPVDNGVYN